jgi:hypothetical protein
LVVEAAVTVLHFITVAVQSEFGLPSVAAINQGHCYIWAARAQSEIGGRIRWFDEISGNLFQLGVMFHAVLELDGKFFDATHPDGATIRQIAEDLGVPAPYLEGL